MAKYDLTLEQLPKPLLDKLNEVIGKHPYMRSLESKMSQQRSKGDYVGMAKTRAKMEETRRAIEDEYIKQNNVMRKRIAEFKEAMTDEQQEVLAINSNMVILLVDMLETSLIEINEVVAAVRSDYRVALYDELLKLAKQCAAQIVWMTNETDEYYQLAFADSADDITQLVRNKVKSLLRKVYKHNREKMEGSV